jgi:uncharacterized protein
MLLAMLGMASIGYTGLLPKPSGQVNDYAHVLSKQNGDALENHLREMAKTGPGIVAIISPNLQGLTPEDFCKKAISEWKIGNSHGGVVLLIAMKERKIQISYDKVASGWIDDSQATRIYSDNMKPLAKNGDWFGALEAGAEQIYTTYQMSVNPARVNDESPIDPPGGVMIDNSKHMPYSNILVWVLTVLALIAGIYFLLNHNIRDSMHLNPIEELFHKDKPKKLTPSQKKRLAEAKAKAHLKRLAEIENNKKINLEKKKAHKMAKRLRKAVSGKLKKLDPIEKKKAKKILHRWKNASRSERKWVSSRVPAMNSYVNVKKSDSGFGVMDFLFWHWVLFPSTSNSNNSDYSGSSSSYSSSSDSDSSSSWSSSSFGSSDSSSSGGFSGGGDSGGGGGGGF